jgi:20S proteasome subunit alpha 7
MVHDEVKDKDFELEISWISISETNGKHVAVPQEIIEAAEVKAKEALSSEMED